MFCLFIKFVFKFILFNKLVLHIFEPEPSFILVSFLYTGGLPLLSFRSKALNDIPGGILNAFAWPLALYRKQRVFIVYCVDYQGI